jgi:histidinol-phosphate aminotransferase
MDPMLRPDLASLPAYVPGRNVPGSIKLASNEVSLPPPPAMLAAVAEAAAAANRYPDMAVAALTEKVAARHGVAPAQVAMGCGSVLLCQQLTQIVCGEPGDEVLYAWRSFEMYPIVTQISRGESVRVPLDPDHRHDLKAMAAAITPRTRMVFVCNPNNPTGTAVTRDELRAFLDEVPPRVLVALDEAYFEFITDPEVADGLELLAGYPNLVVLRTFSKAYRLAGLRVGYAVGHPPVIEAVRKVYPAFSVSSIAQAAASAALDCLPELLGTCAAVAEERIRVRDSLLAGGYAVPPSSANFVWLPLGATAMEFAAHCERAGVIVRPFAGDGVRVTVAGADENDVFLAAARTFSG